MKHFGELVSASFLLEKQEVASWLERQPAMTFGKLLSFSVFLPDWQQSDVTYLYLKDEGVNGYMDSIQSEHGS